jgi:signal transduction histidine kinase
MTASQSVSLAACVGQLALGLLCVVRATRSPLAVPLALLCLDIFGWTGAGLAYDLSGDAPWHWLDHALTPWTAPLALQFVLVFVGRRRALRRTLVVVAAPCGLLSAASLASFFLPSASRFIGSEPWSTLLVSLAIPTMIFATILLGRHARESTDAAERTRARLILAAVAIGTVLGATDEMGQYGVPGLAGFGMLFASAVLSVVALRLRLFDRAESLRAVGYVLALGGTGTAAALVVVTSFRAGTALAILVAATVTLAVVAVSRRWFAEGAERRARRDQLATLGRFSAQMAHDLKNPLAALKGAAQLLREDIARPSEGVDRALYANLLVEQAERLEGVVDLYGRLARVEPELAPLDVNATVRAAVALESLARKGVVLRTELATDLPACEADGAMVARVVENLLRNAVEAMPEGGTIVVRTENEPAGVVLSVVDDGCGMDARSRVRAFDDFFTTKALGSGLGLAFVQRIVHAHGGDVALRSEQGRGTEVRVRLPRDGAARRENGVS